MTTAITRARPDDVLRAAALLGATADQLGTAISACRQSAAVSWVGRAQEQYQRRLERLGHDLVGVRAAFDAACDALLQYGQALAYAQPLSEEADRLTAVGDEALLPRVDALRWEATQTELSAAARLVVALDELTSRAPASSGWVTAQHDAANFATGVTDFFHGVGALAGAAVAALPGVGSAADRDKARDELEDAAAELAQPWKQVQELVDAIRNGEGFRTLGGTAAAVVFRMPGRKDSRWVKVFGTHDEMTAAMLTVMRRGAQAGDTVLEDWAAARVQRDLVEEFTRLQRVPLPSLDELLHDGVDLVHQETSKAGHTMIRHIGRDADFLRYRQQALPGRYGPQAAAAFSTLDEAEAMVDRVLRAHVAEIRAFLALTGPTAALDRTLAIEEAVPSPVGVLVDKFGNEVPATGIRVVLVRERGTVAVETAFPVVVGS